jgi:RimJ/RimL family protein N-acetyltransferase
MRKAMQPICLHDKREIEAFLRRDTFLHLYGLGDLDDDQWPHTTWYAAKQAGRIAAVVLVYTRYQPPTVLALGKDDGPALPELLDSVLPLLPERLYAHLSPGLPDLLEPHYHLTLHGEHLKLGLLHPDRLDAIDTSQAAPLSPADADHAAKLYQDSYAGHWFHPSTLGAMPYFGIHGPEGLLSIAGCHTYSENYGVSALGNIATHPAHRNRGLGKAVTAALCRWLSPRIQHIGLNVKADNAPAIACYRGLGFEPVATYYEYAADPQ